MTPRKKKMLWTIAITVLVTVLAVVLCALGAQLFRRHAGEMVDEL